MVHRRNMGASGWEPRNGGEAYARIAANPWKRNTAIALIAENRFSTHSEIKDFLRPNNINAFAQRFRLTILSNYFDVRFYLISIKSENFPWIVYHANLICIASALFNQYIAIEIF